MYTPDPFRERDPRRLQELVDAHEFGTLIAVRDDGAPEISHLPFLFDPELGPHGTLRFHVSRANSLAKLAASRPLTAVFAGPHGYVSASWYESPREQVPTWNYAVVHAHGRARELTSDELRRLLADLAARHETATPPWRLADLEPAFVDELLRGIVGFSIAVERFEGKFKLSQNRSPADRTRVKDALRARGEPDDLAMLRLMG